MATKGNVKKGEKQPERKAAPAAAPKRETKTAAPKRGERAERGEKKGK